MRGAAGMQEKTFYERIIKILKVQLTRPGRQARIKKLEIELGITEPEPEVVTLSRVLKNEPIYKHGFLSEARRDLEYYEAHRAQQIALARSRPQALRRELDRVNIAYSAARLEDSLIIDSYRPQAHYFTAEDLELYDQDNYNYLYPDGARPVRVSRKVNR
jgi:hypothetical protein